MACTPDISAARRKRLLWRATHRGIKEMDILIGGYVEKHIRAMDEAELTALEAIIEIPDQQLLSWATRQETLPSDVPPLLKDILRFEP